MPEKSRGQVEKNKLSFDLLSDAGNSVASQLGLVFPFAPDLREAYQGLGIDLAKYNGDSSWTLPMPARFVVTQDGVIRYAESDPDYTVRPEPGETIAALRAAIG